MSLVQTKEKLIKSHPSGFLVYHHPFARQIVIRMEIIFPPWLFTPSEIQVEDNKNLVRILSRDTNNVTISGRNLTKVLDKIVR